MPTIFTKEDQMSAFSVYKLVRCAAVTNEGSIGNSCVAGST